MKVWPWLMRTVGVICLVFPVGGFYFQILAVQRVLRHLISNPQIPFFHAAFFTMTAIDAILLIALVFVGILLLRLQRKAATTYTWLVVIMNAYIAVVGGLWLLPEPLGRSIGAASGIGNVGIGPLLTFPIPFVYPLASVLVVNLAQRKLNPRRWTSSAGMRRDGGASLIS